MKQTIIEKAGELFLTRGFKNVTMDDLAGEMGISKKTLYEHFATKTVLIEKTVAHFFQVISGGIDTICSKKSNPIEELFEVQLFLKKMLKNENASPQYQLEKYYPEIHRCLAEKQYCTMHECFAENIDRGIEQRLYRRDINREMVVRLYIYGMLLIKDEDKFPPDEFPPATLRLVYLEHYLRSIVTEKGLKELIRQKKRKEI